jgi:hypothetical protein
MKWYIGQQVVCVETHSMRAVVKGNVYVIQSLRSANCSHYGTLIDVGVKMNVGVSGCNYCGTLFSRDIFWLDERKFRPLETDQYEEEIEAVNIDELLEELLYPIHK